jgi:aspartate 1-decarboxylase
MKDYLGNKLEVGDKVVFMLLSYRDLRKGEIIKFSPKMVFIKFNHEVYRQFPTQVIKIPLK